MKPVPVIDLFAGPGGLGEGFSASAGAHGEPLFRVRLSIEKDVHAHSTLELRAFFRQFARGDVPVEYYLLLQGLISREDAFNRHPVQAARAMEEAWLVELGPKSRIEVRCRVEKAIGSADPWVLIGGPPCQAYSIAGRSRNIGVRGYVPENDLRQTLYREYLQLLADNWPAVFVMENVKGLLSARLNGASVFDRIISDLQSPAKAVGRPRGLFHYNIYSLAYHGKLVAIDPADFIVQAEKHGIPQARHRLILLDRKSVV